MHSEGCGLRQCYYNILYEESYILYFEFSFYLYYCNWPKGIAVRNSLDLWYQTHTQVRYGTGKEKNKSIDCHYNLLKELKGNSKDKLIKRLECIYLVILFKEKM